jgi:hypothetical protein
MKLAMKCDYCGKKQSATGLYDQAMQKLYDAGWNVAKKGLICPDCRIDLKVPVYIEEPKEVTP